MAKRWTREEDIFLHEFADIGLAMISRHDLNRSEEAVKRRVAFLKETGAWDAITRMKCATAEFAMKAGHRLFISEGGEP